MEIKTSSQIEEHLDSIDTLDSKYDDYFEAYSNEKWVKVADIIKCVKQIRIELLKNSKYNNETTLNLDMINKIENTLTSKNNINIPLR